MWTCILCSAKNFGTPLFDREAAACGSCSATWRARAMALAIISGLGYKPKPLHKINSDWSRIGIGISDDVNVSSRLSTKFFYSNTFFDVFPNLDIRNIPKIAESVFEFVSCSDVLEHIDTGLNMGIRGISRLLKPNGFAVLSVPVCYTSDQLEFYPGLKSFEIVGEVVKWKNRTGEQFTDSNPEFHGGRGQNLAFRQFTDETFRSTVLNNGFKEIEIGPINAGLGVPASGLSGIYIARV